MRITNIKRKKGKFRVYNFETKKHNNYFANNILVHNCFSYTFKSSNPSIRDNLGCVNGQRLIKLLEGNPQSIRDKKFYEYFIKRKFLLHWGGMADPFCYFERTNKRGFPILQTLGELNYPTLFSTKGEVIFDKKYTKLFEKYAKQKNFAFQVSMVTFDDELAKKVEMGVMSPKRRIAMIKMLSDMGYYTILRLRPFIIGVTDDSLEDLLGSCLEAGIGGVSTEFFAVDSRGVDKVKMRNRWLGEIMGIKDFYSYFKELSPSERGGYYRLNRLVKERFVKTMYKFCAGNNLVFASSDPDYKELNTSGSCCGMPDDYPGNRLLENWSKSQLGFHLKELRRKYHLTGEDQFLRFDDAFPKEEKFMDDNYMAQDHVYCSDIGASERKMLTHRILARQIWNNLRSPANPRNYFHGIMMPCGVDENESLVYKYNPQPYEEQWKKEGIDLTR